MRNIEPPVSNQLTTIVKAMRVLEALGEEGPMGVTELSRHLGMDKSIVSRILSTLRGHSFVRVLPSGKHDLGLRVFELGQIVIERLPFRRMIVAHVEALAAETDETAYAGTINQGEVVYLYDAVSDQAIRLGPRAGLRRPPWGDALGMVILAFQEEGDVLADLRAARRARRSKPPTLAALRRQMEDIRRRGFCVQAGPAADGVAAVAAPIRDHTGRVTAALGVGGPAARFTKARVARLTKIVTERARQASIQMGGPRVEYDV